MEKNSPYQIHIMGHSHVPYNKIVHGIHYINPGSTGQMYDKSPQIFFVTHKVSSERKDVEYFHLPNPVKEFVKAVTIPPVGYLVKVVSNGIILINGSCHETHGAKKK